MVLITKSQEEVETRNFRRASPRVNKEARFQCNLDSVFLAPATDWARRLSAIGRPEFGLLCRHSLIGGVILRTNRRLHRRDRGRATRFRNGGLFGTWLVRLHRVQNCIRPKSMSSLAPDAAVRNPGWYSCPWKGRRGGTDRDSAHRQRSVNPLLKRPGHNCLDFQVHRKVESLGHSIGCIGAYF